MKKVFRKNAAIMPLYSLVLLFVFFAGFAAILQVPGLKGGDVDLSLFRLALQTFDPWFIGIIGSAGVLTALVPGSMLVMAASTLLAKNIYRTMVPSASDRQVAKVAKLFVPVVTLVAVLFTFKGGETIGALLLMGYSIVTQLFPALVCSLFPRQTITKQGAIAGMGDWVISGCVYYFIWFNYSYDVSGFPSIYKRFKCRYSRAVNEYDCDVYR